MNIPEPILAWLLEGEPWVRYLTRTTLLDLPENDAQISQDWVDMLDHPKIRNILAESLNWPGQVVNGHKNAALIYHKLAFLSELGLDRRIPEIAQISEKIMSHDSDAGPFQVVMNIPKHFGGTGEDSWSWALCDAPVLAEILCRFGYGEDPRVQKAIRHLDGIYRPNGWPCAGGGLGKFRGPGRKEDPCPYATFIMVKLLSAARADYSSPNLLAGAEILLQLWKSSREQHPYMFYMGTDFRKTKLPFIWYDILHVATVLARIPEIKTHPVLNEMISIIRAKQNPEGLFVPESVYLAWKDWDFGQKKEPSRLLTLFVYSLVL
ncbi:MAG TPA: hypothetical protein DC042_00290 [Bacteroidales bacterium]|nr:hypothetical protein [Bacteroidales bacterium]